MNSETDDPYFRDDPGPGLQRVSAYNFDLDKDFHLWKLWRTNDGRVLPNIKSSFSLINNPFGSGDLIQLTAYFDPSLAGKSFGGFGIRAPINPALALSSQTYIEFDFYYPESGTSKFMRFEIWSTTSGGEGSQADAGLPGTNRTQYYIRTAHLNGISSIDYRCGYYYGKTWYKYSVRAVTPVSEGSWEFLNIDLHTETGTKVDGDQLMIGNIRITQTDANGVPIPDVVNKKNFFDVDPVKGKYNHENGGFLVGVAGAGTVDPDSIRGYHYEIFVDDNGLKPERHLRPPKWLRDEYLGFVFKPADEGPEWGLSTGEHLSLRDSGKPGEYKIHGHCLAWINQSPHWMRQIIPENITSMQWDTSGLFYAGGVNAAGPFQKVNKNTARRIYFNHIMYELRHFMTTDERYGSSEKRGVIPFHSFDVLNIEIHESRHSHLIIENPQEWKTALKHISWLMAMTDDDIDDIRQHYIYLLFKYAHIAIPNESMAAKYKAGYDNPDIVPEYMKLDNNDKDGSIDAYICEKPPILVYNDYEMSVYSKAKTACNMINELNTLWKTDPLYDGRNLIECMGIQTHEMVSQNLIANNLRSIVLFTELIDGGLLDCICYSEIDIKQHDAAPGGEALAPAVMNQKQADCVGYQYALLFKMFEKYKKYIDHVILWGLFGSSWMNSYVLFDHQQKASQAYYGVMDPDRFILGHSYLDSYFDGEYEKLKS